MKINIHLNKKKKKQRKTFKNKFKENLLFTINLFDGIINKRNLFVFFVKFENIQINV